jgi:hypothetical protein
MISEGLFGGQRGEELKYKRVIFWYLIGVGFGVGLDVRVPVVYMSGLVLIWHLAFLLYVNFRLKPYQRSLKIHRRTLFICHLVYLIFLIYINLINWLDSIP